MKIEMCDNTTWNTCVACATVLLIAVGWFIYDYNVQFVKRGYTQVQLQNSQMTMWVTTNSPSK